MLRVKTLDYKYKNKKVLEDITFDLNSGDILGIVGPNGSGKTTLITLLATHKKNVEGKIMHTVEAGKAVSIGYIPQEIALFTELTVLDNFKIFGKIENTKDHLFLKTVKALGLEEQLNSSVSKLSGGTKRRVNIGVELVRNPGFIYMDEPIVGIDYSIRDQIIDLIKALSKEGKIIVIASHNVDFLKKTCGKLLKLETGKQIYFGEYNDDVL